MRTASIALVFLHLSACAAVSPSRDAEPPSTRSDPCRPSGTAATGSGTGESVQASGGRGLTFANVAIFALLGLVSAIAGCSKAAAGAVAASG